MNESSQYAEIFAQINGVTIICHYKGDNNDNIYVHCKAKNKTALNELIDFANSLNCDVSIYRHGKGYCYCVVIHPTYSYKEQILSYKDKFYLADLDL